MSKKISTWHLGLTATAAGALAAAVLGFTAPAANALPVIDAGSNIDTGVDHRYWLDQIQPQVAVPHVDTSVHQSR